MNEYKPILGDAGKMDHYGMAPSTSRNYYKVHKEKIKRNAVAYTRRIKKEDPWRYFLITGAGYALLGTRVGGLASWLVCTKWRKIRNDPRLCFYDLSTNDKIKFVREVSEMTKEFPKGWNEYWTTFEMLFDKYIIKDWER